MKWLLSILSFFLVFTACTTTPGTITQNGSSESENVQGPIEVKKVIPLVTLAVSHYADGLESGRVVSTWNDEGYLVREETWNASKILSEYKTSTLSGSTQIFRSMNGQDELQSIKTLTFNKNMKPLRETFSNSKEEPQSISEWVYDEKGNLLSWKARNGSGTLLAETIYLYNDKGQNQKIELKDASGLLTGSFVNAYNSEGLLTKKTEVDATGKTVGATVYTYEKGVLIQEDQQTADGILLRSIKYLNNSEGWPVKIQYIDRRGRILEIKDLTYTSITRSEWIQL